MIDPIDNFVDDSSLWKSFLAGNDIAFTHIYKKYVQTLFHYGMQFSSDRELVKDCIQDIFISLYDNKEKIGFTDNIKFYLFRILKNHLINTLKRHQTHIAFIDSQEKQVETYTEDTAETLLIDMEVDMSVKATVDNVMSLLTIRQREIIYYRFVENMSIDEISILTEMNYQSVANVIQRSLKKIRSFYKKSE